MLLGRTRASVCISRRRLGGQAQSFDVRMQALIYIYVFAVWCVATILLRVVSRFEPNPRLAFVLRFLIIATGAAAITSRLMR
jgi:hypothetical protein